MTRPLRLAIIVLLAMSAQGIAEGVVRLRIVPASGPMSAPHKVLFGGTSSFYATIANPDEGPAPSRFRPARALRGVEWWVYRTHDLDGVPRSGGDGTPGQTVGHVGPGRQPWGHAAVPFVCPDDLRTCWSAGRYVIRAVHPDHGEATLEIHVFSIVLFDFSSRHDHDRYEARFRVGFADPDSKAGTMPLAVAVIGPRGRVEDRAGATDLQRDGDGFVSARPIRLSSKVSPVEAAARATADDPPRWPVLRAVPEARLRLTVLDREYEFEFALPIEEGLLVRRNSSPPFGREGAVLVNCSGRLGAGVGRARGSGSYGRDDTKGTTRKGNRPNRAGRPKNGTRGEADRLVEIVSNAGRGRRLRAYLGEPITFAARLRPRDLEAVFRPTEWLRDVHWTLERLALPTERRTDGIAHGASVIAVGRRGPRGLWGDPPTTFLCPEDVHGTYTPGRYVLRAERRDGTWGSVRIDLSAFEIVDVKADLTEDHYEASLRFRLTDPSETRTQVPVEVRVITERDRVRDHVRGVTLVRDTARRGRFLSGAILFSTRVKRPCQDRYGPTDGSGKPPGNLPEILQVAPGSRLRVVLGDAVFTYPLPLSVYEILTGRSGASDQPR